MKWWDLLKVQQTLDMGYDPQKPVSEGAGITGLQQRASQTQQYQPAGDIVQQQLTQSFTPISKPKEATEYQKQPLDQHSPQTAETAGGASADDSDVGEGDIRENVKIARENLVQLPKGPKAKEIVSVITDLSESLMEPEYQLATAVAAKKKLHAAFPQTGY